MSKKNNDEYITVFYGIDIDTNEVGSAWLTRGGTLSINSNGNSYTHSILPGRNPVSELIIICNLGDIIQFTPDILQSETCKKLIADLEEKANKRRLGLHP